MLIFNRFNTINGLKLNVFWTVIILNQIHTVPIAQNLQIQRQNHMVCKQEIYKISSQNPTGNFLYFRSPKTWKFRFKFQIESNQQIQPISGITKYVKQLQFQTIPHFMTLKSAMTRNLSQNPMKKWFLWFETLKFQFFHFFRFQNIENSKNH